MLGILCCSGIPSREDSGVVILQSLYVGYPVMDLHPIQGGVVILQSLYVGYPVIDLHPIQGGVVILQSLYVGYPMMNYHPIHGRSSTCNTPSDFILGIL